MYFLCPLFIIHIRQRILVIVPGVSDFLILGKERAGFGPVLIHYLIRGYGDLRRPTGNPHARTTKSIQKLPGQAVGKEPTRNIVSFMHTIFAVQQILPVKIEMEFFYSEGKSGIDNTLLAQNPWGGAH